MRDDWGHGIESTNVQEKLFYSDISILWFYYVGICITHFSGMMFCPFDLQGENGYCDAEVFPKNPTELALPEFDKNWGFCSDSCSG